MERQRPERPAPVWPVTTVVLVGLIALLLVTGGDGPVTVVLPTLVAVAAAGVAAWAVRRSRRARADYDARLTEWAASEAVLSERVRIASDLHDIVSHALGLITVRAAAARLTATPPGPAEGQVRGGAVGQAGLDGQEGDLARGDTAGNRARHETAGDGPPAGGEGGSAGRLDEALDALADIENASRGATAELRRMLTVLRSPDAAGPRTPLEGLERLDAILAEVGGAGVRARLNLDIRWDVSWGVQVAVCHTVREGLRNVARHTGPSDVEVDVYHDEGAVVTAVVDDGPDGSWHAVPGAGHGLVGLRERVAGLGGTLRAEPEGRGFRLEARIPDEVGE